MAQPLPSDWSGYDPMTKTRRYAHRRIRHSQRIYVMGHGHMVFHGTPDDLKANKLIRQEWLEV